MALSLVCGAECQIYSVGLGAAADSHWSYLDPPISIVTGRDGVGNALQAGGTSSIGHRIPDNPSSVYARFYFKFQTQLTYTNIFTVPWSGSSTVVSHDSSGVICVKNDGSSVSTSHNNFAISLDTWYGIEIECVPSDAVGTRWRWWSAATGWSRSEHVDGTDTAGATTTGMDVRFGRSGPTGQVVFDDIAIGSGEVGEDYDPYYAYGGKVLRYSPTSDGTHSFDTTGDFEKTGVDIVVSDDDVYSYLDAADMEQTSEYIECMAGAISTEYVEVQFADEATEENVRGVSWVAHVNDAAPAGTGFEIDYSTDDFTTSVNIFESQDVGGAFYQAMIPTATNGASWTPDVVNAFEVRYKGDLDSGARIYGIALEVEWVTREESRPSPHMSLVCGANCQIGGAYSAPDAVSHWATTLSGFTPSVTSPARPGSGPRSFEFTSAASTALWKKHDISTGSPSVGYARFYFYQEDVTPPGEAPILQFSASGTEHGGIYISTSGVLGMRTDDDSAATLNVRQLSVDTWYAVEVECELNVGMRWRVWDATDGWTRSESVADATQTAPTSVELGLPNMTSGVHTVYITDIAIGTYDCYDPWYASSGSVLRYNPNADGTHTFDSDDFKYNSSGGGYISPSATDVWQYLNWANMLVTNKGVHHVFGKDTTNQYLEVLMSDRTIEDAFARTVMTILTIDLNDDVGIDALVSTDDFTTSVAVAEGSISSFTIQCLKDVLPNAPDGTPWTNTNINSVKARLFGGLDTDSGLVDLRAFALEVEWVTLEEAGPHLTGYGLSIVCGAECQIASMGTGGSYGIEKWSIVEAGNGSTPAIVSNPVRSGSKAFHFKGSATGQSYLFHQVASIEDENVAYVHGYFRVSDYPTAATAIFTIYATGGFDDEMSIRLKPDGTMEAHLLDDTTDVTLTPTVPFPKDTWVGVEFEEDCSREVADSVFEGKWRWWTQETGWSFPMSWVRATPSGPRTLPGTAFGLISAEAGNEDFDLYMDDWAFGNSVGLFNPIGPNGSSAQVLRLTPTSDGTHSFTSGDFDDASGVIAPTATDIYQRLDAVDMTQTTDWVRDILATYEDGDYIEVHFGDVAHQGRPRGVSIVGSFKVVVTGWIVGPIVSDDGVSWTPGGTNYNNNTDDELFYQRHATMGDGYGALAPSGSPWTLDRINSLRARWVCYDSGGTPQEQRLTGIAVEVEWLDLEDAPFIYGRPIADLATTGWVVTPLWSKVDDDPDDPDGTTVTASV